ncbi:MAG TPA: transglycosylase domain-containing protein [Mycobacteriales bacterium]|nr:transglycosylase domain-containing protein [Mycobacteriales bacterium]
MPQLRPALLRLLSVCAVLGLVVAGIMLPVVGGAGLFAGAMSDSWGDLPAVLRMPPPPERSRLLANDGSTIASFFTQDRANVPLSKIAPVMQHAIVAIEDARFFHHGGVDLRGTLRAAATDLGNGGAVQGGSTLTQQYVKNALLDAGQRHATSDTLARKLREARYAIELEKKLSKQQILERYLNIVYFGEGAYGVESAAMRYFGVHASHLTLPQAALLAGLVQSPTDYDPLLHPQAAKLRRDTVLARMAQVGAAPATATKLAAARPLGVHLHKAGVGCQTSSAPFYCDYVFRALLADPRLGPTPAAREKTLMTGGLTIRTAMDPQAQRAAQNAVDTIVPIGSRVATAVDVVQPGTGAVVAMAVDRRYGSRTQRHETRLNLATGGMSGFQAGSTFKMFTLAAAIEHHVPLSQTFHAPPQMSFDSGFRGCGGVDLGGWKPVHNAEDGEGGTFGLVRATWESVNTYFAQLERKVGVCAPWQLATQTGIREILTGKPVAQVPAFTLGVADTSPLQVAGAYAMLAARGVFCAPYPVLEIRGSDGKVIESHRAHAGCRRVLPQWAADRTTSVLRGVIDGPDPKRTGAAASIGRPAAGKTGTTDNFTAAWFSGYTPQLAASVWVGDPRGGATHPLRNVVVGGRFYSHVYGADLAAPVWRMTMSGALRGVPARNFAGEGGHVAADQMSAPPGGAGLPPVRRSAPAPKPAPRPGGPPGHHRH